MTVQNLQTLKGFRDFLPAEARKRAFAIGKIKQVFERFGFEPLETPALEYKELLLGKYGEEADKLVYTFKDKGDRDVAMRYDQTVPTARVLAMYNQQLPMPWRRFQIQPVWRAENTQKGRYREFLQCDGDIFGTTSPLADAEVVSLIFNLYIGLGFQGIQIFINDRKVLFDVMEFVNVPENLYFSVIQSIDKLDKKSKEEVSDELKEKGLEQKAIEHLFNHLESAKPTERLAQVIEYANALGTPKESIIFQPGLARGLDYYTSSIFEVYVKDFEHGALGGGGRYDKLINDLCGVDIPAVGYAIGFDRTIDAMEQFKLFPSEKVGVDILVTVFNSETVATSAHVTQTLRANGINAELYPSENTKLDKQLKYADKKGIKWLVVVGPEEAKNNTVILKNLENGQQEEVSIKDLIEKTKEFSMHYL